MDMMVIGGGADYWNALEETERLEKRIERLEMIVCLLLSAIVHGIDTEDATYLESLEAIKPIIGPLLG
jgi:hypothetical protein